MIGFGALAYFSPPSEWIAALGQVPRQNLALGGGLFACGCLSISIRWRACLSYRVSFLQAFHSQGIAMAGNLLIPGRSGEPLRVYALAQRGLPAEYATSGVVQERLADQLFRVLLFATALMLGGSGGRQSADYRLLGIILATLALFGVLALLVRYHLAVASFSGRWLGRLPKLNASTVERFVRSTLLDLALMWTRPAALVWGGVAWLFYTAHMSTVLEAFFPNDGLEMACVCMSFGSPTTSGKPGGYHLVLVAAMMAFSADKGIALKAAVVLFLFQVAFYSLWGVASWFALKAGPKLTAPVGAEELP